MEIQASQQCVALAFSEYDVSNVESLRAELAVLAPGHCIVDFRNVRFLDTTGLSELIRTLKRLRAADPASSVTIVNVQRPLARIFHVTGLERLFAIQV